MGKNNDISSAPILFPYEPEEFWKNMRAMIREEMKALPAGVAYSVEGMNRKPLYKIGEVCSMFGITRPTIYDWIKHGKLKPYKVRSRVYFLWKDLEGMFGE